MTMLLRGGGGEPESIFRNWRPFLCLTLGECCVVLIELSIHLFVNALSLELPALLVASLVVRWLLYNVHSLLFNMCDCYCRPFVFKVTPRGNDLSYIRENGLIRGTECSKTHPGISLFSFPRKRAGINPFPPSNVLGVQLALWDVATVLLYCLDLCQAFIHSHVCESERLWVPPWLTGSAEWPLHCP